MADRSPLGPWPEEGRATHALVDLDAIAGNLGAVAGAVTSGTRVMAVVKANGYGHGAVMVAEAAIGAGASSLGVATVDEAVELRHGGVSVPILVLGGAMPWEYATAIQHRISLALATAADVERVAEVASGEGDGPARVHLKLDSGMNRYGGTAEEVVAAAGLVAASPNVEFEGVFTHFADADGADLAFTRDQADALRSCVAAIEAGGVRVPVVHAANSAAILRSREFDFDLVRLGISLYGIRPDASVPLLPGMRPALTLRSRLTRMFRLGPGETVSYGRTYEATTTECAALVPAGYADGLPRLASNRGWVAVDGERCPIRGRVCMDQTVVGLPPGIAADREAPVILAGGDVAPALDDLAAIAGTIPYEIATGITARVPRWYARSGRLVAVARNGRLERLGHIA